MLVPPTPQYRKVDVKVSSISVLSDFFYLFNETKWKYSCRTDTKHLQNYPDSRNASMNLLMINRHSVLNSCLLLLPCQPTLQ